MTDRDRWNSDAVQVGTVLVIASGYGRDADRLYSVERVTPKQVVTERNTYRIDRETGRIRGAHRFGPFFAYIATPDDIATVRLRNMRESLRVTRWSDVPDDVVRQVWALVNPQPHKEVSHD